MKVKVFLNGKAVDIPAAGKLSTGDEFLYEEELWKVNKSIPSFYETGEGSELILKCSKVGEEPDENPKNEDPEEDEVEVLGKSGHGISDLPDRGKSGRKAARVSEKVLAGYDLSGDSFEDTVLEWLHQCRVYGIPDPDMFKDLTPKLYDYYDKLSCVDPCPSPKVQFIHDIAEYIRDKFPRFERRCYGVLGDERVMGYSTKETEVEDWLARMRAAVWKQVTGGDDIRDVHIPRKPRQVGARNLSSLKGSLAKLPSTSYWDSDVYEEFDRMLEKHGLLLSKQEWNQLIEKDADQPEGSLREWSRYKYMTDLFDKYPEFQELVDKIGYHRHSGGKRFEYTFENLQLFRNIVWKKLTGEVYTPSDEDAIEILRDTVNCLYDTESFEDEHDDGIEIDTSRRTIREIDDELEYEDKSPFGKAIHILVKGKPRKHRRGCYDDEDDYDEI